MAQTQKVRWTLIGASLVAVIIISSLFVFGKTADDNPLNGVTLYTEQNSSASRQAASWRYERPEAAAQMVKLAGLPMATWLTSDENLNQLDDYLHGAAQAKSSPLLVVYNIPLRDCGMYSAGGVDSATKYKEYIDKLAAKLKTVQSDASAKAIVILEPDALAAIKTVRQGKVCLTDAQRQERYNLIKYAVTSMKSIPRTIVYIDAGNSAWEKDITDMAQRLQAAGVQDADGFSLNVSNFQTIDDSDQYGQKISDHVDGKHFVIDTSRNGNGPYKNSNYPDYTWCNPPGRALGHYPTTDTGRAGVDAYLYIKIPGESDGKDADPQKCFGGPTAGQWNPEYALGLIKRWPKGLQP